MDKVNQNLIFGALVADAATLGFHWLYNQQRISKVADNTPAFHTPTKSDYQGVLSFFAHGGKSAGDLSLYGEQALVLLKALSNNKGAYDQFIYQDNFRNHFGYGGDYSGFIDRPTKDTLDNITITEYQSLKNAHDLTFYGTNDAKQTIINATVAAFKQSKTAIPQALYENISSQLETEVDSEYLNKLIDCFNPCLRYQGADDVQLPAISKLPSLVAVYALKPELTQVTESAVRVTNNNDQAVAYGYIASQMMETAVTTKDINKIIEAGRQAATPDILPLIDKALAATNKTIPELTQEIGMSCNLEFGVPSIFHNLALGLSYVESIQQNIFAGGDSCGRSILLGAILGAVHGLDSDKGIPEMWLHKLNKKTQLDHLINTL